jgi:pimeloyl-ACP methyl ester carboxylesterase
MAGRTSGSWLRVVGRVLLTGVAFIVLALAVLAVRLLSPISTPAFRDAQGDPVPGSIAVAERWRVNGASESVIIRGRDRRNPVLIWLHGGPGSSETPVLRVLNGALEDHFTVVYWDQRLAGQTLVPFAPPPASLTVGQMLSDLEVVVDRVRARLGQDKVILVGHSWGTMLGVLYASRHPDKVASYVGIGQMSDKPRAEALSYDYALGQARRAGDPKALADLRRIGPPPYRRLEDVFVERAWLDRFGGVTYADMSLPKLVWIGLQASEANWRDLYASLFAGPTASVLLEPQMQNTNLDRAYTRFETPVFIVDGRHDYVTSTVLAHAYFDRIAAPQKGFVLFECAGHNAHLEEPARFNAWMIDVVRPAALGHQPAAGMARSTDTVVACER